MNLEADDSEEEDMSAAEKDEKMTAVVVEYAKEMMGVQINQEGGNQV